MTAVSVRMQDNQGNTVGGLILLDQGNRRLTCDWEWGACTKQAVAAVYPSTPGSAPQLACLDHLAMMHNSLWSHTNPPRLLVQEASFMLGRNEKAQAS